MPKDAFTFAPEVNSDYNKRAFQLKVYTPPQYNYIEGLTTEESKVMHLKRKFLREIELYKQMDIATSPKLKRIKRRKVRSLTRTPLEIKAIEN